MSDLSRLPGIEDCLSNVLSYCTIEDMLTCHKLSSSWKVTLESHSLKKCWASRLKKSVQDNEMILKSSSNQIIYQINVQSNVDGVATVEQRSVDDFSFFTDSREDWNRICYKFIQDGSIEDIIQFSTLLVASLRRVERPMNRYGPIDIVLSIFAVVSKKMSLFVLSKEQQQTFDLVVIYSLEFL